MKKLISLILILALALSASAALAKTVLPDQDEFEGLAGMVVNATVGEYVDYLNAFKVTVYENDRFDDDDVEFLSAGDILLAGGRPGTVKEMTRTTEGDLMAIMEDGSEIVFVKKGDDYLAYSTDDDRQYMHAIAVLTLNPAEGIVYEDNSDPDLDAKMKVVMGLEEILKAKAEKEETSIGFDFYATKVTLNEKLEIERIHQDYDVAQ